MEASDVLECLMLVSNGDTDFNVKDVSIWHFTEDSFTFNISNSISIKTKWQRNWKVNVQILRNKIRHPDGCPTVSCSASWRYCHVESHYLFFSRMIWRLKLALVFGKSLPIYEICFFCRLVFFKLYNYVYYPKSSTRT